MDVARYEFSCQKALHQGLQYARSLGHQLLECEHVALAMLRADAVQLPGRSGDRLKRHLENHLARAPRIYGSVKIGFGQRLDAALDMAEKEVGTQLVSDTILWKSVCRQSTVIQTFIAKAEQDEVSAFQSGIRTGTMKQAAGAEGHAAAPKQEPTQTEKNSTEPVPEKVDKNLRAYTIDLTAMAERGELDPVIGRDTEVRRVLEILGRKKKNNPLLIGEPGVGKSAVAEAIALRIAENHVPESMRGKRVLSLDLGAMLAGAKYRGEFEDRMKNVLKAVESLKGQIILFIDEIHMLVGAGNQEGGADAANLLKPALARGELQCLGATTLDEYRKYIEKDPALERRFQPLLVEEPSKPVALAILRGLKSRYEIHHGVQIDDEALTAAVDFSVRYLTQRKLPDKAIDLIDEASSRLRLQIDSVPTILDELKSHIDRIEIERKAIGSGPGHQATLSGLDERLAQVKAEYGEIETIWRHHQDLLQRMKHGEKRRQEALTMYENAKTQANFDFAARLQYDELPKLDAELASIIGELGNQQDKYSFLRQVVGAREIAEVVAAWARVPVGRLLEDDAKKLLEMDTRLERRVYGQTNAIRKIVRAVKRARVGVNDPRRPLGVFLFLGPTGVGKTETAKALAAELFNDDTRMIRIDMSEYMEAHSVARMIGAPPGYVGFGEGGELTEAIRHHPYSVVLFDEIEKANPRVLDLMLQVFDDGRLTDSKGRTVDFRNALIIMTSNLGLDRIPDPETATDQVVRDALSHLLRPELVNRIDECVVFNRLGRRHVKSLLNRLLEELNGRLVDRQFRVVIGTRLGEKLMDAGSSLQFGGRAMRRAFETMVVDAVSDRVLGQPEFAIGAWQLEIDEDGLYVWAEDYRPQLYLPPAPKK